MREIGATVRYSTCRLDCRQLPVEQSPPDLLAAGEKSVYSWCKSNSNDNLSVCVCVCAGTVHVVLVTSRATKQGLPPASLTTMVQLLSHYLVVLVCCLCTLHITTPQLWIPTN